MSLAVVACARIVGNQWITFYSLYLCIYSFWTFVFSLIGVSWVMPKLVVNLLACWKRGCWLASGSSYLGASCVSCGLFGEN